MFRNHPNTDPVKLAARLKISQNLVYTIRRELKKTALPESNGHVEAKPREVSAFAPMAKQVEEYQKLLVGTDKAVEKQRKVKPSTQSEEGYQVCLGVPVNGLTIKLNDGKHSIGTLTVDRDGIRFTVANAKKKPTRSLPWETFHSLMVSGLLG